ncbi:hypothetical protein JMUB7512_27740 [Staphylococcus aureus]
MQRSLVGSEMCIRDSQTVGTPLTSAVAVKTTVSYTHLTLPTNREV